jgi:putative two-component system response regulator
VSSPIRILVVDDEATLRSALSRYLAKQGYQVESAASGGDALDKLRNGAFHVMLLDIRMHGVSGIDVVPEAVDIDPDLAILMLSAVTDATSAAICMQRGAMDYLTKPIELSDLGQAVQRALKRRDTLLQTREISDWLREEVERRTRELERSAKRQDQLMMATLEALINALEAKNSYLAGHSARVSAFAATMADEMRLSDEEVEQVRLAGRLHDLGKIGTRESVLDKQGPLTDDEYEHVKQHVTIGAQILAPLTHLGAIVNMVRSHHEHWDGSGYPDGLAGDDIPLGARIIGAAEVYDALTTARPYQDPLTPEDAADRMRSLAGKVIDPSVMDALAKSVERRQTLVFLREDELTGE